MIYTLYQRFELGHHGHGNLVRDPDTIEIVPETKATWALVFPPLWLAWHGLWAWLFVWILFTAFILTSLLTPYWPVGIVVGFVPGLYLWLEGHQLRREKLEASGYELTDVIEAPDEATAFARMVAPHVVSDIAEPQPQAEAA